MRILAPGAGRRYGLLALLLAVCAATWALLTVLSSAASTTDFYVDLEKGSDSNSGRENRPWRTIQKAADTIEPGETVHVRPGSYGERVQVSRSGSAGAAITYRAEGAVTLKGFTVRADYIAIQGFEITNTDNEWDNGVGIFVQGSYCILENNYVHDATRGGIVVFADQGEQAGPTGCQVRNNRLYHNALSGIEINGSKHVVEGNEIWGTIQYHPKWADPPSWADADGIRFFGSGHHIRRNYIHDISFKDPENVNPHIDCFQTWGPASDIRLEYNHCEALEYQAPHERGQGFMIERKNEPVRNLILSHNVVRAYTHVVVIHGDNLTVTNNAFIGDLSLPVAAQGSIELFDSPSATIQNNVFYDVRQPLYTEGSSSEGLLAGDNVVLRGDGRQPEDIPAIRKLMDQVPPFAERPAGGSMVAPTPQVVTSASRVAASAPKPRESDGERVPARHRLPSHKDIFHR